MQPLFPRKDLKKVVEQLESAPEAKAEKPQAKTDDNLISMSEFQGMDLRVAMTTRAVSQVLIHENQVPGPRCGQNPVSAGDVTAGVRQAACGLTRGGAAGLGGLSAQGSLAEAAPPGKTLRFRV